MTVHEFPTHLFPINEQIFPEICIKFDLQPSIITEIQDQLLFTIQSNEAGRKNFPKLSKLMELTGSITQNYPC
jgi:hypothetical protein